MRYISEISSLPSASIIRSCRPQSTVVASLEQRVVDRPLAGARARCPGAPASIAASSASETVAQKRHGGLALEHAAQLEGVVDQLQVDMRDLQPALRHGAQQAFGLQPRDQLAHGAQRHAQQLHQLALRNELAGRGCWPPGSAAESSRRPARAGSAGGAFMWRLATRRARRPCAAAGCRTCASRRSAQDHEGRCARLVESEAFERAGGRFAGLRQGGANSATGRRHGIGVADHLHRPGRFGRPKSSSGISSSTACSRAGASAPGSCTSRAPALAGHARRREVARRRWPASSPWPMLASACKASGVSRAEMCLSMAGSRCGVEVGFSRINALTC